MQIYDRGGSCHMIPPRHPKRTCIQRRPWHHFSLGTQPCVRLLWERCCFAAAVLSRLRRRPCDSVELGTGFEAGRIWSIVQCTCNIIFVVRRYVFSANYPMMFVFSLIPPGLLFPPAAGAAATPWLSPPFLMVSAIMCGFGYFGVFSS